MKLARIQPVTIKYIMISSVLTLALMSPTLTVPCYASSLINKCYLEEEKMMRLIKNDTTYSNQPTG